MKTFFQTVKNSVSSRAFYLDILKGNKPVGFLYTFILHGLVSLVVAIFLSIGFFASLPALRSSLINTYPADLIVTIKDGKASINQPSPIFLADKSVVIDTRAKADLETLQTYKVRGLVTSDAFVFEKTNGIVNIIPLKEFPDFVMNQEKISSWTYAVQLYAWIVPIIIFVSMWLFGTVGLYIGNLIYALIVWLVLYLLGHKTSYRNAYSVTLYARTIPVVFLLKFLPTLLIVIITTLVAFKSRPKA